MSPGRAESGAERDAAPARLSLAIQFAAQSDALPGRAQLRRWVASTLAVIAPERASELTLRFVDAREGRALNHAHRGRDHATNVLTFNLHEDAPPAVARRLPVLADIVVCVPVVGREARAQRKRFADHCAHMIVHGVLHAHGYDHQDEARAHAMEALERRVLARFRIADPYAR